MRPQAWHLILLLVVILLVFGASRLPDITRNVGKSLKIFKNEVKDLREDGDTVKDAADTSDAGTGYPQPPASTQSAPPPTSQLPPADRASDPASSQSQPSSPPQTHDAQPPSNR